MKTASKKTVVKSRTRKASPPRPEIISGIEGQDYTLTRLEKMQGSKHIYKLEFNSVTGNRCTNYIDDENKHIVFKDANGQYVLLKLPTSYSKNKSSLSNMKKKMRRCARKKTYDCE